MGCPRCVPTTPVRLLQTASNQSATKIALYNKGVITSQNKFRSYKNFPHPWKISHPISQARITTLGTASAKHMEEAYQIVQIEPEEMERSGASGYWQGNQQGLPYLSTYSQEIQGAEQNMRLEPEWIILPYYKGRICMK